MLTKKTKNRIYFFSIASLTLFVLFFFIFKTLNKNLLYFKTPTEISQSEDLIIGKNLRIGGMVKKDSIVINKENIRFIITDLKNEIIVSYQGTVPNLFLEEKGVIAEGRFKDKKYFKARRILAKHDENYMPPLNKKDEEKGVK